MERYTASYANTRGNFVFQNMYGENVENKYFGVYCILKNILQRGTPTPPSVFLQNSLGLLEHEADKLELISDNEVVWFNRIKGDEENGFVPALGFFNELIPEYFGEYSFVRQLLLPETMIDDIVPSINNDFYDRQVDFYLPQAKLVIEIDGSQHEFDKVQIAKDTGRDNYFFKNGIATVRIPVKNLLPRDKMFLGKIEDIINIIRKSEAVEKYRKDINCTEKTDQDLLRIKYDTVIRFQLLIISFLQKNLLSFEENVWKFSFINAENDTLSLFKIASEDLLLWLKHLLKLRKLPFNKPKIRVSNIKKYNKNSDAITIDFSIYKRWTDEADINENIIYVRNDYFDDKDYFQVSNSDSIKYELRLEGDNSDLPSLLFILKNVFMFDAFRDGQLAIITNVLRKIDTIGILPTGSGKSLCYQFCALLQPCISFIVCPILSLMYDQKENLDNKGITRTNHITSDHNASKKNEILKEFENCKYFFIWISPERFQNQPFREALQEINFKKNFALAVIDEVHCLSEWGHDFRTSYLTLVNTIRNHCPEASLLGLTATASQFVLNDLQKEFQIDSFNIKTSSSMNRDELNFCVVPASEENVESKYKAVHSLLNRLNRKFDNRLFELKGEDTTSGLVFTVTKSNKNGCNELARKLSGDFNLKVHAYHGSLGKEKKKVQDGFKNNKYPLLAATKAFGMGIDKGNIRYTIHYGLPWSIEAFYQEAGRAGRDKKNAYCYIIYKKENCEPEIIDEIFDLKTDMARIDELSQSLKHDLSSIMFLWKQNNKGVEHDLKVMSWVMRNLYSGKTDIVVCNSEYQKPEVEKAIYRLSLLGFINDWTIEDWGNTTAKIKVYVNEYSVESVKSSLLSYIRRYDPQFSETEPKYGKYFEILADNNLKPYLRYMRVIVQWTYDNIVYSRRQTIKNMKDVCDNYIDSDHLKSYIDNYFRFSDRTLILDQISFKPGDYNLWFELFYQNLEGDVAGSKRVPITRAGAESLIPSLQRYLESYRYNTGLNFVSGMLRLLCDRFEDTDGRPRFEDAFGSIEKYGADDIEKIIAATLDIGKYANQMNKEYLADFLLKRYPGKAKQIYLELEDNLSLTFVLEDSLKKLNNIEEYVSWQISKN